MHIFPCMDLQFSAKKYVQNMQLSVKTGTIKTLNEAETMAGSESPLPLVQTAVNYWIVHSRTHGQPEYGQVHLQKQSREKLIEKI